MNAKKSLAPERPYVTTQRCDKVNLRHIEQVHTCRIIEGFPPCFTADIPTGTSRLSAEVRYRHNSPPTHIPVIFNSSAIEGDEC